MVRRFQGLQLGVLHEANGGVCGESLPRKREGSSLGKYKNHNAIIRQKRGNDYDMIVMFSDIG